MLRAITLSTGAWHAARLVRTQALLEGGPLQATLSAGHTLSTSLAPQLGDVPVGVALVHAVDGLAHAVAILRTGWSHACLRSPGSELVELCWMVTCSLCMDANKASQMPVEGELSLLLAFEHQPEAPAGHSSHGHRTKACREWQIARPIVGCCIEGD